MKDVVVATAVRVEYNNEENKLYVVFEILDEKLKKKVKENWLQDIKLKIIDDP